MRIVINLFMLAVIAGLIYLLINSINTPIKFRAEKNLRENAVAEKLRDIRTAQEMYRNIYNEYAPNFEALKSGLDTGYFSVIKVIGDPDAVDAQFTYDTIALPSKDSVQVLGFDLANFAEVPYSNNVKFNMKSDTMTYQKTLTHVLEVGVRRKDFMGEYADPKFAKYDDNYNPNSIIKFGSLDAPNLGGNWE